MSHKEETTNSRPLSENLFLQLVKETLEVSLPLTLQPATGPYSEPDTSYHSDKRYCTYIKVKVKQSHYRPKQSLRFPGG